MLPIVIKRNLTFFLHYKVIDQFKPAVQENKKKIECQTYFTFPTRILIYY